MSSGRWIKSRSSGGSLFGSAPASGVSLKAGRSWWSHEQLNLTHVRCLQHQEEQQGEHPSSAPAVAVTCSAFRLQRPSWSRACNLHLG